MNEKPYAKRAVEFADALVKQQFEAAYGMLGERLREGGVSRAIAFEL